MLRCFAFLRILLLATPVLLLPAVSFAQLVPGSGTLVNQDKMEDPKFIYTPNLPKSSKEEDEQVRYPLGGSNNGMWFESPKRGSPDSVKWVEAPVGALPGSTGCLYLRTRDSGVPGHPGYNFRKEGVHQAQDDFIMKARPLSVSSSPSTVVRVYLPAWENWEQRNGVSFGLRAGMQGPMEKEKETIGRKLFGRGRMTKVTEMEPYYPGFFIQFIPGNDPNNKTGQPYAMILLRSDELGHEMQGPVIREPGWWTLGMSVTPDSRVHYYASPGVDDLTQADYIRSSIPYGIRGTTFNTIFFNVCSADNGQSWSTPWIIDDPSVYAGTGNYAPTQQAQIPAAPQQQQQ
ncbi:hypothetical protein [Planctomicrobium piriforme]|uniref:Uncharacterized protein n=1 Tax=Planctomicrobium piriforme TaxID=1576369 RepID=A0A1I3QYY9_9PLAN|nr:hypothetical protein [Planctomicrobium piriforme]SFJ38712.1 hypothetical protein SAMN05421753_11987 [Planctomicrobium piriforme]